MGLIGANRRVSQEKCVICEKTFPEDELELQPYTKTKTLELMCKECTLSDKKVKSISLTTEEQPEKNKIKTEKKENKLKELVNEETPDLSEESTCTCAKLPMCKAIRATQAWDEFSNKEMKAFFIGGNFDHYKINYCPFCGKSLYKK